MGGRYDRMCDLWSCGVVMFLLLSGYPPFRGETEAAILALVRHGNFVLKSSDWECVSASAKDLVRNLLKMNPLERVTADQALRHVWFHREDDLMVNVDAMSSVLKRLHKFHHGRNRLKANLVDSMVKERAAVGAAVTSETDTAAAKAVKETEWMDGFARWIGWIPKASAETSAPSSSLEGAEVGIAAMPP